MQQTVHPNGYCECHQSFKVVTVQEDTVFTNFNTNLQFSNEGSNNVGQQSPHLHAAFGL